MQTNTFTKFPCNYVTCGAPILGVVTSLFLFANTPIGTAAESTLTDKTKQAVETTKEVVRDSVAAAESAGKSTAEGAKEVWRRIDEARLSNRTPDEIVAWVMMGVLVGAVAGMLTGLKPTGLGKVGRFLLGLLGAFIGGMVVHVGRFDFGWGPVLIRYEELLFSLVGAGLLVGVGRIIRYKSKKEVPRS